jgi:mono/diheme cytochrome c family protein
MRDQSTTTIKEQSSLLIFVPLALIGLFFIYLFVSIPFHAGGKKGQIEAAYLLPSDDEGEDEVYNHQQLVRSSQDLIDLGTKLYTTQCASCHGKQGMGDGTAGQRLVVKPRDFTATTDWTNSRSAVGIYGTLESGLGGNMPAFPQLNPKQKYAVIHYIQDTYMKDVGVLEPSEEELAGLPAPSAGGGSINIDPYAETRVPVEYAMMKMSEKVDNPSFQKNKGLSQGVGKEIYIENCAACHGRDGQGVKPDQLDHLEELKLLAKGSSLLDPEADWGTDYEQFKEIVVKGIPEGIKPGFGTLTEEEMTALYEFTHSLRQGQE